MAPRAAAAPVTSAACTWRRALTALFIVALAAPLVVGFDDLPLSRYQMYASPRSPELTLIVAVGIDDRGNDVALAIDEVAATRDPLIAESWLRQAVELGSADRACAEIAARVDRAAVVEIRTERHDLGARARGDESLTESTIEARCLVGRDP